MNKTLLHSKNMPLTLIISSLSAGGAERVMSIFANYWAEKGVEITLLTFDDGSEPPFYPLHPAIKHYPLNLLQDSKNKIEVIVNTIKRIWSLRTALKIHKRQTIISVMAPTNVLTIVAAFGLGRPVIVWEQVGPEYSITQNSWRILRNLTYLMASRVTLLTQSSVAYFSPAIQRKTSVIPNPALEPPANGNFQRENSENKTLVAFGRLDAQKGFDLLLRAMAEISSKVPAWNLHIWGEGPLRGDLEKLRDQLGLQNKVQFPGLTKKSYEVMKKADLFVMSSRFEGLPLALVEAMACGLPVISFGCNGPKDIIRDGIDGLLVPPEDVQALSAGMEQLMNDEEKRKRLSRRAPEVLERYGLEKVMALWDTLIREVNR